MRSHRELRSAVRAQTYELARKGPRAKLPQSATLLQEAVSLLIRDPDEHRGIRLTWRHAALCRSADRAFAEDWAGAYAALNPTPASLKREPAAQNLEDTQAKALMLANRALAGYFLGKDIDALTSVATREFWRANNPRMRRWHGTAWALRGIDLRTRYKQQCAAVEALRHIDRQRQPKLHVLALWMMTRRVDGVHHHTAPKQAKPTTQECLYHFND